MKKNTREDLLNHAEVLFSENGFYGTSISDIAKQVNVSKQALLHHFSTKEKIYAAVLEQAAEHLGEFVEHAKASGETPKDQLRQILFDMTNATGRRLRVIILLLRELLDNRERAESAQKWYLRPFLDALTDIVSQGQQTGCFTTTYPLAFVYHLLGATQYFVISRPTLRRLYTSDEFNQHFQSHKQLIEQIING